MQHQLQRGGDSDINTIVGQKELSRKTGYTRNTFTAATKELVASGWLEPPTQRRFKRGELATNEYFLLDPKTHQRLQFLPLPPYFTVPACIIRQDEMHWSLRSMSPSDIALYTSTLFSADLARKNTFPNDPVRLRKMCNLTRGKGGTFSKAMESLQRKGLIVVDEPEITMCNPLTGKPPVAAFDAVNDPANYYTPDGHRIVLNTGDPEALLKWVPIYSPVFRSQQGHLGEAMAERLNRKELYDLVWSEPMKPLSARFGISDVALKKACARVGIPTPERGYWAKKDAGKEVFNPAFPLRPPGMSDEVEIGAGGNAAYGYRTEEDLLAPNGAPPVFSEPIEAVRARIVETVGHITIPRKVLTWHPAIDRLLKEDEKRREKQLTDRYVMSWEKPVFDSPFERRRLRILNSLFFAVGKMNGRPSVRGREARDIGISFFQQHLQLALDKPKRPNRRAQVLNAAEEANDTRLCLSILKGWGSEEVLATWQDVTFRNSKRA